MMLLLPLVIVLQNCSSNLNKINFDIAQLDDNGLIGNENGKVTVAYEFCIPKNEQSKNDVYKIDSSIKVYSSPGRIKCSNEQYLCIGETNRAYKQVLNELTLLPYVLKIDRCFFE